MFGKFLSSSEGTPAVDHSELNLKTLKEQGEAVQLQTKVLKALLEAVDKYKE
jgi:hypothetical protein